MDNSYEILVTFPPALMRRIDTEYEKLLYRNRQELILAAVRSFFEKRDLEYLTGATPARKKGEYE